MLDYLAYGAIGIAMATTILTFRLLASEQKKEHPNESILKMIKWFMGLTVFFSIFFGVIEIIKGGEESPTPNSVSNTVSELKSQSTAFTLNQDDQGSFSVQMIDTSGQSHTLGDLSDRAIEIVKEKELKNAWHVRLGATKLGRISTAWNLWDLRNNDQTFAYLNEWCPIDKANSKLMFKIESINSNDSDQDGAYMFKVRFGEVDEKGTISPSKELQTFYSTRDGGIDPFHFVPLNQAHWKNEYYAGLGLGQPTKSQSYIPAGTSKDATWNRVQRFNGAVIQMNLKNR